MALFSLNARLGWLVFFACVVLTNHHLLMLFESVSILFYPNGSLRTIPFFTLFYSDNSALSLLFVCCGYALTERYMAIRSSFLNDAKAIVLSLLKLLLFLIVTTYLVLFLCWVLNYTGGLFVTNDSFSLVNEAWPALFPGDDSVGLFQLLSIAFFDVPWLGIGYINYPLWSLNVFVNAGLFLMAFLLFIGRMNNSSWRFLTLGAFTIFTLLGITRGLLITGQIHLPLTPDPYGGFFLGAFVYFLRGKTFSSPAFNRYALPVIFVAGLWLLAFSVTMRLHPIYFPFHSIVISPFSQYAINSVGAGLIIFFFDHWKSSLSVAVPKILHLLKDATFSLYLSHFLVIVSLTSFLYQLQLFNNDALNAFFAMGVSYPFIFILAYGFESIAGTSFYISLFKPATSTQNDTGETP